MKKITTEKGLIMFIKLPYDSGNPYLATIKNNNVIVFNCDEKKINTLDIPDGNWQLIGLTSEVTEEQAKMMVDEEIEYGYNLGYVDYTNRAALCGIGGLESFKSLMQANEVYEVNPYGKVRPKYFDYSSQIQYEGDCADFDKAESRSGNWIILFKEK